MLYIFFNPKKPNDIMEIVCFSFVYWCSNLLAGCFYVLKYSSPWCYWSINMFIPVQNGQIHYHGTS